MISSAPLTRRTTKGPLDLLEAGPNQDPLSPTTTMSPISPLPPTEAINAKLSPPKDFSYLLRPEIYHPLTQLDTPAPFRTSDRQPPSNTPIETLLASGHFRAAAIASAQTLLSNIDPTDHNLILSLMYTRLACLTLINATALAAQEVKSLEDLNAPYYRDDVSGVHLVPWELRVLAVRLQGMGFSDPRRGVVGYYELGKEARMEVAKARRRGTEGEAERDLWEARLRDLGLRVASALVEMEDLDGAARHLNTLAPRDKSGELNMMKALLWLRMGDLSAARHCIADDDDDESKAVILALSDLAEGMYDEAVERWRSLCQQDASNAMYAQNLAVCLLYTGRMGEVSLRPFCNITAKLTYEGATSSHITCGEWQFVPRTDF